MGMQLQVPQEVHLVRTSSRNHSISDVSDGSPKDTENPSTTSSQVPRSLDVDRGHFHFDVKRGIYLKTPFWMVTFFFLGLAAAIAHHSFYKLLDGDQVGSQAKQEWNLRFGSAFAYIAQIALVASVAVAYTQWLWRTLSLTALSVECLDAAFDADMAIISLLNKEFVLKVKLGACLALLCWFLQLPSLITPATLNVKPTIKTDITNANVSSVSMQGSQWKRFAISFNTSDDVGLLFAGPRTVVQRLVTATATEGIILPIHPPFTNSTYNITFEGPAIICETAAPEVAHIIDSLRNQTMLSHDETIVPKDNRYYGFVPSFSSPDGTPLTLNNTKAIDKKRLQEPIDGTNQLWMVYSNYQKGFDHINVWDRPTVDHFIVCKLYRASYTLGFSFQQSLQNVTMLDKTLLEEIPYPGRTEPQTDKTRMQHAYSAVMWAISDLLIGKMGTFTTSDNSFGGKTQFSEISTQIAHTSLLGSSDLRVFFDKNRERGLLPSDQTQEDIRFAGGRSLDVLIQELAFNVTASFMNSPLLSPSILRETVRKQSIITYDYSSRNLYIAYGLATFFALIANILGLYAFWLNKASHTRTFSARVITTRGIKLTEFVHGHGDRGLTAPLGENITKMKVRFDPIMWGFVRVGSDGDEEEKVVEKSQHSRWQKLRRKFSGKNFLSH